MEEGRGGYPHNNLCLMRISTVAAIDLDRVLGPEKGAHKLHTAPVKWTSEEEKNRKIIREKEENTNRFWGQSKVCSASQKYIKIS